MKAKLGILAALAGVLVGALPMLAHHSFTAEYDSSKPVTLKGKVVRMEWINPHSWLHVAVTDASGKTEEWSCETPPPNGLFRAGWRKNMIKEGDEVTVQGFLAKDGSNTMWSQFVTLPNGTRFTLGSAPGAPAEKGR
jgi:Family of unknown function (DUF6152)